MPICVRNILEIGLIEQIGVKQIKDNTQTFFRCTHLEINIKSTKLEKSQICSITCIQQKISPFYSVYASTYTKYV